MVDAIIRKIDESVVEIETSDDIHHNIYMRYSEYMPGYQFNPRFKLRVWDREVPSI